MRTVYRLLGLVRSYGAGTVEVACARLDLDVVDVTKISQMLEQAREREPSPAPNTAAAPPNTAAAGPARVSRDAADYPAGAGR